MKTFKKDSVTAGLCPECVQVWGGPWIIGAVCQQAVLVCRTVQGNPGVIVLKPLGLQREAEVPATDMPRQGVVQPDMNYCDT